MTKQGEDLYHYNITNRITEKSLKNCVLPNILLIWKEVITYFQILSNQISLIFKSFQIRHW
jgi:hypothetical protein